ncbi:hypothetical protein D3C78_367670 [compost metagenome]
MLGFGQQDTVGHQLDQGVGVALVLEPHLVTDQGAQRCTQLFSHTGSNTARGNPPWLGVGDQAVAAAAQLQADLG